MPLKPDDAERDALVQIRAHQDAANVGGLAELLASDAAASSLVRFAAVRALERLGDERATDALLALLDDDHESVREAAVQALGQVGGERAVPVLVRMLDDRSRYVRGAAAAALGQVGGDAARDALERIGREDPARSVRVTARRLLKRPGGRTRTALRLPRRR